MTGKTSSSYRPSAVNRRNELPAKGEKMNRISHSTAAVLAGVISWFSLGGCGEVTPEPPAARRAAPETAVASAATSTPSRVDLEAMQRELAPRLSRTVRDRVATPSPKGGLRLDLAGR